MNNAMPDSFQLQSSSNKPVRVLLDPNSAEFNAYLAKHREALESQYDAALKQSQTLARRLKAGEYGPINGVGVELNHKRGLIVSHPSYGITVFVPKKLPDDQLRKRRPSRREQERNEGNPSQVIRFVRIPKSIRGVQIKVQEANPTYANRVRTELRHRESIELEHDLTLSPSFNRPLPITGGVAISGCDKLGWGTLGLVFESKDGSRFGATCAHVVENGEVHHPPNIRCNTKQAAIGNVVSSKRLPLRGVDASFIDLDTDSLPGVIDVPTDSKAIRCLVSPPARRSYWSWLAQRRVVVRGASTGHVVHGRITMPTVHTIEIAGDTFRDLFVVQSNPASASIVEQGDSGSAVLMEENGHWVWIGIVVGMIHAQQLVACKLPNCLSACDFPLSKIPVPTRWKLGN